MRTVNPSPMANCDHASSLRDPWPRWIFSVGISGKSGYRHGQLGSFTEAAGAQKPGYDGTPHQGSDAGACKTTSLRTRQRLGDQ